MLVREVWRYPVKSMGGHRVPSARIDQRGLHADRLWAVRDLELGATTTARRLPALMQCTARFAHEPPADAGPGRPAEAIITLPAGDEVSTGDPAIHARLSELVGRAVELRPLPPVADKAGYRAPNVSQADLRRQFAIPDGEPLPDLSMFPLRKLAQLARYATPPGSYADAYPVHVLTTGTLEAMRRLEPGADFDVRRFRPTLVVEGEDEPDWCGDALAAGDAVLRVAIPTVRCSMPVRPQPGLPAQPGVMRAISAHRERCLGVYATVERSGRVSEGDGVERLAGAPRPATRMTGLKRGMLRVGSVVLPE